ncbi:hypothetical protein TRFO_10799 [Tritrichomonas foetus]|uniref:Uncharacterized protein n=1 Tax=Tritrichomonas foetus TaxID=1144522 RepID=A0A1J4J6Q4_9EUKA|nr:hypothetical protein TRFO_10799 [Tritrichomonas foetus]|eukprot:OHS94872.1 hypothetical protein TRFO_10799 [Tritrichomonas foetus]
MIPSPASHYQVLRKLIFELVNDKIQQDRCSSVLKDFVKLMPEYPASISQCFSQPIIMQLNSIVPNVLSTIASLNPQLIPPNTNLPVCEISLIINSIITENNQTNIDSSISNLGNLLKDDDITSLAGSLTKMVENLIEQNKLSSAVLSFISKLILIIPNSILFMKLKNLKTENLNTIIPISLQTASELDNSLLSNIIIYRFAYSLVLNLSAKPTIESVIPLHRLTLSGSAPVEAVIYALNRLINNVKEFIEKSDFDAKIAFGAVLSCILSCVEIPELKSFVLSAAPIIISFFESISFNVKSISVKKAFQSVLDLFYLHGSTPINYVYACWFKKPPKYQILNLLQAISPVDPSLPALIKENVYEINKFPYLICILVKKVIFSPSIANIAALQYLADSSQFDEFIIFTNSILNHEFSFYATHFISLFSQEPDFTEDSVQESFVNILNLCLLSESHWSVRHLEHFSKWIPSLSEQSLVKILLHCQQQNNTRASSRFLLMMTYTLNFAVVMPRRTKIFGQFLNFLQNLVTSNNNDASVSASLCIAWHNLYMSILNSPKSITNSSIKQMFTMGVMALVKIWDMPDVHNLIVEAFCDALSLEDTRKIIMEKIGITQGKDDRFVNYLIQVDETAAFSKFPGLRGHRVSRSERKPPSRWGAQYWMPYVCGHALSIKL